MGIQIPSQIRLSHHAQRPTQRLRLLQAYRSLTTSGPAGVRVVAEPGLDVPEGTALNLSCHLPGSPGPMGNSTFAWFWNGRQLHTEPVPTLAFTYVALAQAGMYTTAGLSSPLGPPPLLQSCSGCSVSVTSSPCPSLPTCHTPTSGLPPLLSAKSKDFIGMESWVRGFPVTDV